MNIPKGKSKKAVEERRLILKSSLEKYIGTYFYNSHLKNKIRFTRSSLNEISWHAAKDYNSTLAALSVKNLIRKSNLLYFDCPKSGNQREFCGWITLIMYSKIDNENVAKITIIDGVKNNKTKGKFDFILYCITSKKADKGYPSLSAFHC